MTDNKLANLQNKHGEKGSKDLLTAMINQEFKNEIALVSSFGSGSALLLSIVAEIDNKTPIIFLDTKKHFGETLEYVEKLRNLLDLQNLIIVEPREDLVGKVDIEGNLWESQPNRCCWLRKVEPLQRVLDEGNYKALITGRKRYQTPDRANMQTIEDHEDGRLRVNPFAFWSKEDINLEFKRRNLPEHPLVAKGYPSIGCQPCTRPVKSGEDERAGRWAHTADSSGDGQKIECGIHVAGAATKPDLNI